MHKTPYYNLPISRIFAGQLHDPIMRTILSNNIYLLGIGCCLLAAAYTSVSFLMNVKIAQNTNYSRQVKLVYFGFGLLAYVSLGVYALVYSNYLLAFVQALGAVKHTAMLMQFVIKVK